MSADKTLEQRIDDQDDWTFQECLGLAAEYGVKTRVVVVTVLSRGKGYLEGQRPAGSASDQAQAKQ